jgi:hypothetical protein
VETWIGLLHSLFDEIFEVELTVYALESEMAGLGSISGSSGRTFQDKVGLSKIARRYRFQEIRRQDPSPFYGSSGPVCPYDGRPARLLSFGCKAVTCLDALNFANRVRKALAKRVRTGILAWGSIDGWGSWKLKSLVRAEVIKLDCVRCFKTMAASPFGCLIFCCTELL